MKELTNQICIKKNNLRAAVDKEEYEKAAEIKMMIEGMQKSLLTLLPSISQSTLNVSSVQVYAVLLLYCLFTTEAEVAFYFFTCTISHLEVRYK